MDFNTVLLCEVLLMNFLNWNICFFSISETLCMIFNYLQIEVSVMEVLYQNSENFINYVFSEFVLYTSYDQFVITLAICKLVLRDLKKTGEKENLYLKKFEQFIIDLELNEMNKTLDNCVDLISFYLDSSDCESIDEESEIPAFQNDIHNQNKENNKNHAFKKCTEENYLKTG
jgi:hypothetical protein